MGGDVSARTGRVVRVNGPLVEVEGLEGVAMLELVVLGPDRVSAEIVALEGARATLQAYEYTGGIRVGDPGSSGRGCSATPSTGCCGRCPARRCGWGRRRPVP